MHFCFSFSLKAAYQAESIFYDNLDRTRAWRGLLEENAM